MPRVSDSAASKDGLRLRCPSCCLPHIKTRSARRSGDFGAQWLACVCPCQRFARVLTNPAHDSGPKWFASPFLCGSFIRYSLPVYPGAFLDHLIRPRQPIQRNRQADLLGGFKLITSSNFSANHSKLVTLSCLGSLRVTRGAIARRAFSD